MIPLPKSQWLLARNSDMTEDRRPIEEWWQLISEFVVPRKAYVTDVSDYVDDTHYRRLYDTTAIDAANTLANGHSSYISPGDQRWFYWGSPEHIRSDEVEGWYRKCSEIAAMELASSNFYPSTDEGYIDRSAFGLCNTSVWEKKGGGVNVMTHPVNSYSIEESEEGTIDTVFFEMTKGIRQLYEMFGDNIGKSEKLAESYQRLVQQGKNKQHKILHCVYPRPLGERFPGSREGKHMPIASVYLCCEGKAIISEGGFEEMPYCVSRYLKHAGRGNQYGFGPSWRAMPTIAQLNFIQKAMDFVAEKQAVPPVLIPDYLEGEVDIRGGGMTMFKSNRVKGAYALPQEWANSGQYDIGVHRVEQKQQEINRAYHVDMLRMFSELDKSNLTATEVNERAGEKLVQFSPSFTRYISDAGPQHERVFSVLLRQGKFPQPPEGAIEVNNYTGNLSVPGPKVVYQSKIALAIQQLQNTGIDRLFERALAVGEVRPDVFDNFDLDAAMRMIGRNDGVPEEVFSSEEVMDEIRTRRAEQQQMQQEMEMAQMGAKAAKDAGMAEQ